MLMGIHPRLERDLAQALNERPVAFPLAMLAVCALFTVALMLVVYGIGALPAPTEVEMVERAAVPDVALKCARYCVSIR